MSGEENEKVFRRVVEDGYNKGNLSALGDSLVNGAYRNRGGDGHYQNQEND